MIITQEEVDNYLSWAADYKDFGDADTDLFELAQDIIDDYDDEEDHVLQQPADIIPMIKDFLMRHETGQTLPPGMPLDDVEDYF